ncbi:MAG TPA: hypothetical protein DCM40_01850 [Maribacter sp.]|nr:hypothetical protein [Maribacter sp.]
MNCWHCNTELIWGGDHDIDEQYDDTYSMVTNLSCPKCDSFVEVYYPSEKTLEDYKKHETNFSNDLKHHEEMYGEQEQKELKESYKQSLVNKKEREENKVE